MAGTGQRGRGAKGTGIFSDPRYQKTAFAYWRFAFKMRARNEIMRVPFSSDAYQAACCQEKRLQDLKKNHPEEYKKLMDELKDAP